MAWRLSGRLSGDAMAGVSVLALATAAALSSSTAAAETVAGRAPGTAQGTGDGADERAMVVANNAIVEELVITAAPVARTAFVNPAQVSVLAGPRKRAEQTAGLGQTLDRLAGVATIATGPQVGKPVIRGLSGNRIRILSNDVFLNFQQYGVRHPANVDPYLADRIEVVRGSQSVLYGSDAMGGAVNLIVEPPYAGTDAKPDLSGVVTAEYASAFDAVTTAVEMAGVAGAWGADGRFVFRDSTGMTVPDTATALETGNNRDPLVTGKLPFTGFDQLNGSFALGRAADWGGVSLRWEGWRGDQDYLVPDPPPPDGDPLQPGGIGQRLVNDLVQLRADVDVAEGLRLAANLTYVRNHRRANAGPPEPQPVPIRDPAVIDIAREQVSGRVVLHHDPLAGRLSGQVGVQIDREWQTSRGTTALTPGGDVETYAVFAFEELDLGALKLDAGLRLDRRETRADPDATDDVSGIPGLSDLPGVPDDPALQRQAFTAVTGSLGASYRLSERLVLAANMASGFRAPGLFDLFVNGVHGGVAAVQLGDPTLSQERSLSTDLSARWQSDWLSVEAAVYRNRIDDYIFPGGTGETDPGSGNPIFRIQQDDATFWGGDIDLTVRPTGWLDHRLTYERVEGSLARADTEAPLLPADRLTNALTAHRDAWGPFTDLRLGGELVYAFAKDAAGTLEPFAQFDGPGSAFGTASTDDYLLVNLSAAATWKHTTLQVAVTNLTDRAYRDFLDTYKTITWSPGRDVRLTLSTRF